MSPGLLLALSMASSVAGSGPVSSVVAPPSASPPPSSVVTPPTVAPPPSAAPPSSVVTPPAPTPPPTDAVRDDLGNLTDDSEDDGDAQDEAAAAPQEPAPDPVDGYIDYSTTWRDPPRSHMVVTQVVHRPVRVAPPAPEPVPSYEPRVHGFVGLSLRGTTTTNHNPSVLSGGRLGFVFADRFTIGGAFYSLTGRFGGPITDPVGNKLGMRMAYGGVLLGWSLYKGRVMQLGLETLAGAGAACVSKNRRSYGKWECLEKVGLVSIEPGLSLGFVVTDWVRVGLTGGYRFVTREAWRSPNDFTLSGPYVGLDIDFGAFRTDDR